MSAMTHSRQALAAQRFVEATRNVDLAFRAVRGDAEDGTATAEHAAAVARLDRALDELARAEALFDTAVRIDARKRN
jgi:citrate lyase beta subunit